jgi:hypothetical protein
MLILINSIILKILRIPVILTIDEPDKPNYAINPNAAST